MLDFIESLINSIKDNKNIIKELQTESHNKSLELDYCPNCKVKLVTKEYKEPHYEVSEFGHTPYETFNVRGCPECGEDY